MSDMPLIAYIAIGMVVFVLVAMNIAMFALLRDPKKFKLERKAPRRSAPGLGNFVKVLRDPFAEERGQLQELSNLVKGLDEKEPQEKPEEK
jgi:hypothetical protein